MTDEEREQLEKRKEALKQEISTLREAITDIAQPGPSGASRHDQRQNLSAVQSTREQELNDVEARLAQASRRP